MLSDGLSYERVARYLRPPPPTHTQEKGLQPTGRKITGLRDGIQIVSVGAEPNHQLTFNF